MADLDIQIGALLDAYAQASIDPETVIEMVYDRIEACSDKAIWISLVPPWHQRKVPSIKAGVQVLVLIC